jgi:hypothetical protein
MRRSAITAEAQGLLHLRDAALKHGFQRLRISGFQLFPKDTLRAGQFAGAFLFGAAIY